MSVVLIEGFDAFPATAGADGGVQGAWTISTTSSWSFPAGRFGGLAAANNASGSVTFEKGLPAAIAAAAVGFAFQAGLGGTPSSAVGLMELRSASGIQLGVGVNSSGQLILYRAAVGTVLATAAIGTVPDWSSWQFVELEATIHDSTGAAKVYLNGAEVISVSGVDTKGQSEAEADRVLFRFPGNTWGGGSGLEYFDDIYVADAATRLGDSRVITLRPAADSAVDWAPSSGGDNFAMVDDAQVDGDSSYVEASSAADVDLYTVGVLGVSPATVHAVQVSACLRKTDASERTARTKLSSNGTGADGATVVLSSGYAWLRTIHNTDPDTAAAWAAAAVEASLIGQELVA